MPASAIEPATGASTWALGSQRWRVYRGVLTINANRIIMAQTTLVEGVNHIGM